MHWLSNEADGGGSIFCDGFTVAEDLRHADMAAYDLLVSTSIPFRFHDDNCDIRGHKGVINLDHQGWVNDICSNPHLASPLDLEPELIQLYYRAYQTFMKMRKSADYKIAIMLARGGMRYLIIGRYYMDMRHLTLNRGLATFRDVMWIEERLKVVYVYCQGNSRTSISVTRATVRIKY